MVNYISGSFESNVTPSRRKGLVATDCIHLLDWLESELDDLASAVENQDTKPPAEAMHMLHLLYQDVRRALLDQRPFVIVLDAQYEERSATPYFITVQVQVEQLPDSTSN
jgi:hypothetical protein